MRAERIHFSHHPALQCIELSGASGITRKSAVNEMDLSSPFVQVIIYSAMTRRASNRPPIRRLKRDVIHLPTAEPIGCDSFFTAGLPLDCPSRLRMSNLSGFAARQLSPSRASGRELHCDLVPIILHHFPAPFKRQRGRARKRKIAHSDLAGRLHSDSTNSYRATGGMLRCRRCSVRERPIGRETEWL
jgi:hypothetical protein